MFPVSKKITETLNRKMLLKGREEGKKEKYIWSLNREKDDKKVVKQYCKTELLSSNFWILYEKIFSKYHFCPVGELTHSATLDVRIPCSVRLPCPHGRQSQDLRSTDHTHTPLWPHPQTVPELPPWFSWDSDQSHHCWTKQYSHWKMVNEQEEILRLHINSGY